MHLLQLGRRRFIDSRGCRVTSSMSTCSSTSALMFTEPLHCRDTSSRRSSAVSCPLWHPQPRGLRSTQSIDS